MTHSYRNLPGTRAAAPFDAKDGNIVLQSNDNVHFRVHNHIISLASPVLSAVISLSPPPPSAPHHEGFQRHKRRPVVELPESSEDLDMFLRFLYPVAEPPMALGDIATLLELAKKYESPTVAARMRVHLLLPKHLDAEPLAVYALASYADLNDVALVAAQRTLSRPLPSPALLAEQCLGRLPGAALVRLVQYRKRCAAVAAGVVSFEDGCVPWWVQLQWRRLCFLSECPWECARLPRRTLKWHKTVSGCVDVPEYWAEYMDAVGRALAETLDPRVACDPRLLRPAVEGGMRCSRCSSKALWDVQEFAGIVEQALEEAIASVELEAANLREYDEDMSRALVPMDKKNYLLPCDTPIWPLYDLFYKTYSRRLEQQNDDPDEGYVEDDLISLPPPSEY